MAKRPAGLKAPNVSGVAGVAEKRLWVLVCTCKFMRSNRAPLFLGCVAPSEAGYCLLHRASALGHKRKWCHARVMSVLPLKADIRQREWHVRFVPQTDIEFDMRNGAAVPKTL